MKYVIITPVRDEEAHIAKTIESVAGQTVIPQQWIIVNDGSKDRTGSIADELAKKYSWIKVIHRTDRGFRKSGGGVIETFYTGYEKLDVKDWEFLVKLDGDLSFKPDYFEKCLKHFRDDPKLGIGGGTISNDINGEWVIEWKGDPAFHVRGATKIYRREVWDAIGGLIRQPGWDTLDELKANMLGWKTGSFADVKILHHRKAGEADGTWKNWVKNGRANYIVGYHPVFMLAKCSLRALRKPLFVGAAGLLTGFFGGYLGGATQIEDRALIRYVRQQQMNRLLGKASIWG